ncbi:hypothetical protein [Sphingobacterium detergens]|uniref:Uncharacterized protein n=1 Tax=Sphingobacterium detergens TaxID=1145106 RepID=A0A420AE85_SPHD1|nr:hypothetical protein [Sphingobacterium detergens]RKE42686.1 hypothetical protein DFQ12_5603 [Sphingobacterium detergens]
MRKILLSAILLSSTIACKKDNLSSESKQQQAEQNLLDAKSVYKQEFSKALAKALASNSELRAFIKNEALKKFDQDYDVLYQMVKDEVIGDKKFKDIIAEQYEKKENLNELDRLYPTLTIFVPKLPMNSFSAEKWDTQTEIPQVAYTLNTTANVPIVNEKGEEYILEAKYTPSFPVVVIKENEVVKVSSGAANSTKASASNGSEEKESNKHLLKGSLYTFEFLDEAFNGLNDKNQKSSSKLRASTINASAIDSKIKQAYDTYKNADGWQRDYIYYDITPGQPKGKFNYDYQEHITSFSMNDANSLGFISDQDGDPINNPKYYDPSVKGNLPRIPWIGDAFRFKVNILVNSKNGAGPSLDKYFTVEAQNLYDAKYKKTGVKVGPIIVGSGVWELESISPKKVPLNIPIFNWDLAEYASTIKIIVEEVDDTAEESRSETRVVKFATNFGIDASLGNEKAKIGLKFGASLEEDKTSTVSYKVTKQSDQLGDVIVNFADKIATAFDGSSYTTREYSSGMYTIGIEPRRVQ